MIKKNKKAELVFDQTAIIILVCVVVVLVATGMIYFSEYIRGYLDNLPKFDDTSKDEEIPLSEIQKKLEITFEDPIEVDFDWKINKKYRYNREQDVWEYNVDWLPDGWNPVKNPKGSFDDWNEEEKLMASLKGKDEINGAGVFREYTFIVDSKDLKFSDEVDFSIFVPEGYEKEIFSKIAIKADGKRHLDFFKDGLNGNFVIKTDSYNTQIYFVDSSNVEKTVGRVVYYPLEGYSKIIISGFKEKPEVQKLDGTIIIGNEVFLKND